MATVIKASDHKAAQGHVAFNFDDMSKQAEGYLEQIRVKAARLVAESQAEAAAIRQQAVAEGKAAGKAEIEQHTHQQVEAKLSTAIPAVQAAVAELAKARDACMIAWEGRAVHLACSIASRIIRREIAQHPEITMTLIREALNMAVGSPRIRVRMNPADLEALAGHLEPLQQELNRAGKAEIVPDDEVTLGGCRIDTSFGTIDQQIEAQLSRIEEELTTS